MLQGISDKPLALTALRSEDIEGTDRMKVTARIRGIGRQDQALEQLVARLSLERSVSSVSWAFKDAKFSVAPIDVIGNVPGSSP